MSGLEVAAWKQPAHSFVKSVEAERSRFCFFVYILKGFLLIDYFSLIYILGNISYWEQVGS